MAVEGRQPLSRGEVEDLPAVGPRDGHVNNQERTDAFLAECAERLADVLGASQVYLPDLQAQRFRSCLERDFEPAELRDDGGRWHPVEDRHLGRRGRHILEELQMLPEDLRIRIVGQSRHVPAGSGQALHYTDADRIGGAIEDDGNRGRRALSGGSPWPTTSHDQIRLETNQLGSQLREPLVPRLRVAELDGEVLALDPSALAQEATQIDPDKVLLLRARRAEDTDAIHFRDWLTGDDGGRQQEREGARDDKAKQFQLPLTFLTTGRTSACHRSPSGVARSARRSLSR